MTCARDLPSNESGYALIATLWLLLLAASLAGLMMLRVVQSSTSVRVERTALIRMTAEESALETAAADLLLNGAASRFGELPATARYRVGESEVSVEASWENERLDINNAAVELIDGELRLAGLDAAERFSFVAALEKKRRVGTQIESLTEVAAMAPEGSCLVDRLTPYQGRTDASAVTTGSGASIASVGPSVLRMQVNSPGAGRAIVFRRGLAGANPLQILETPILPSC